MKFCIIFFNKKYFYLFILHTYNIFYKDFFHFIFSLLYFLIDIIQVEDYDKKEF